MNEESTRPTSDWWRAKRYSLAFNQTYITPAADVAFERYNPWQVGGSPPTRPHLSFSTLIRAIEMNQPEWGPLLLRWVAKHGLLGLLPHRVAMVTLAPRLVPRADREPVPLSIRYVRTAGGWTPDVLGPTEYAGSWPAQESEVDPDWRAGGSRAPGVLLRGGLDERPDDPSWTVEPLAETWGRYFPSIPESDRAEYLYPPPASEEFWRIYAEPTTEILRAGRQLLDLLEHLKGDRPLDRVLYPVDEMLAGERTWRSWDRLNALVEPTSLAAVRDPDGSIRRAWSTPSLLGVFGIMALEDVASGFAPRFCATDRCTEVFVPTRASQTYHSKECRAKQQKRNQRARAGEQAGGG